MSDKAIYSVLTKAEIALTNRDIETALRLVHDFVVRIITEPICTAQVFASRELDALCLRIGRQNLSCLPASQEDIWPGLKNGLTVVYLVSRIQKSGGHSRLVQNFINAQPEKNHLILSTEVGGTSDKDYFLETFASVKNVRIVYADRGRKVDRLKWLQLALINSRAENIYLLNHHQDSVAAAALVPELGLKGSFVHHGDHHLCLGVHHRHLAHIDLHPMGYHYCRDQLGIDNHYLPLIYEDKGCVPVKTEFMRGGSLTTATAARWNKVERSYYVSYMETVPRLLKTTGGQHIHIGRLTPWALRQIYSRMRKLGIPKDRFIYLEWMPSVWTALQRYKVDLYIASFPYGGGLTLIEAMGAGVPVILHQHMYSRVLSGLELAYTEAFSWSDPEKLLRHLAVLKPEDLIRERELARQHYEYFHLPKVLEAYLCEPESFQSNVPKLSKDFNPRYDEWANSIVAQLNLNYILSRYAYRLFLRIRSLFH